VEVAAGHGDASIVQQLLEMPGLQPAALVAAVQAAAAAGYAEVAGMLLDALAAREDTAAAAALAAAEGPLQQTTAGLMQAWLEYGAVMRALEAQRAAVMQVLLDTAASYTQQQAGAAPAAGAGVAGSSGGRKRTQQIVSQR
jgi:hypothetical protein